MPSIKPGTAVSPTPSASKSPSVDLRTARLADKFQAVQKMVEGSDIADISKFQKEFSARLKSLNRAVEQFEQYFKIDGGISKRTLGPQHKQQLTKLKELGSFTDEAAKVYSSIDKSLQRYGVAASTAKNKNQIEKAGANFRAAIDVGTKLAKQISEAKIPGATPVWWAVQKNVTTAQDKSKTLGAWEKYQQLHYAEVRKKEWENMQPPTAAMLKAKMPTWEQRQAASNWQSLFAPSKGPSSTYQRPLNITGKNLAGFGINPAFASPPGFGGQNVKNPTWNQIVSHMSTVTPTTVTQNLLNQQANTPFPRGGGGGGGGVGGGFLGGALGSGGVIRGMRAAITGLEIYEGAKLLKAAWSGANRAVRYDLPDLEEIAKAGRTIGMSTTNTEGMFGAPGHLVLDPNLARLGYTSMKQAAGVMNAYGMSTGAFGAFAAGTQLSQSKFGGFQSAAAYQPFFAGLNRAGMATGDRDMIDMGKVMTKAFSAALPPKQTFENMESLLGMINSQGLVMSRGQLGRMATFGAGSAVPTLRSSTALQSAIQGFGQMGSNILNHPVANVALLGYMRHKIGTMTPSPAQWKKFLTGEGFSPSLFTPGVMKELANPIWRNNPSLVIERMFPEAEKADLLSHAFSYTGAKTPMGSFGFSAFYGPASTLEYSKRVNNLDARLRASAPISKMVHVPGKYPIRGFGDLLGAFAHHPWEMLHPADRAKLVHGTEERRYWDDKTNKYDLTAHDYFGRMASSGYNISGPGAENLGNIREANASYVGVALEASNALSRFAGVVTKTNEALEAFMSALKGHPMVP